MICELLIRVLFHRQGVFHIQGCKITYIVMSRVEKLRFFCHIQGMRCRTTAEHPHQSLGVVPANHPPPKAPPPPSPGPVAPVVVVALQYTNSLGKFWFFKVKVSSFINQFLQSSVWKTVRRIGILTSEDKELYRKGCVKSWNSLWNFQTNEGFVEIQFTFRPNLCVLKRI